MSWYWEQKPTWRKDLITCNSHPWIMFSFNWLVIIWRGRGFVWNWTSKVNEVEECGHSWTRGWGVLKIGQFSWTSYVYPSYKNNCPCSIKIWKSTDQKSFAFGHFFQMNFFIISEKLLWTFLVLIGIVRLISDISSRCCINLFINNVVYKEQAGRVNGFAFSVQEIMRLVWRPSPEMSRCFPRNFLKKILFRRNHPDLLLRKGVLKICSKFTGEHPCRNVISIELQTSFIEITL